MRQEVLTSLTWLLRRGLVISGSSMTRSRSLLANEQNLGIPEPAGAADVGHDRAKPSTPEHLEARLMVVQGGVEQSPPEAVSFRLA